MIFDFRVTNVKRNVREHGYPALSFKILLTCCCCEAHRALHLPETCVAVARHTEPCIFPKRVIVYEAHRALHLLRRFELRRETMIKSNQVAKLMPELPATLECDEKVSCRRSLEPRQVFRPPSRARRRRRKIPKNRGKSRFFRLWELQTPRGGGGVV